MSTDTEPVTLPSGVAARFVGQRMPRTEDQRMITGHGRYIDDLDKPGMVHAAFVRSQVAAGRITGLDVSEARADTGRHRGADRGRGQPEGHGTQRAG